MTRCRPADRPAGRVENGARRRRGCSTSGWRGHRRRAAPRGRTQAPAGSARTAAPAGPRPAPLGPSWPRSRRVPRCKRASPGPRHARRGARRPRRQRGSLLRRPGGGARSLPAFARCTRVQGHQAGAPSGLAWMGTAFRPQPQWPHRIRTRILRETHAHLPLHRPHPIALHAER